MRPAHLDQGLSKVGGFQLVMGVPLDRWMVIDGLFQGKSDEKMEKELGVPL